MCHLFIGDLVIGGFWKQVLRLYTAISCYWVYMVKEDYSKVICFSPYCADEAGLPCKL